MNANTQSIRAAIDPGDIALRDDERQPCEVWTRVMGYHRPVASFNAGKKGEHQQRRFFEEARADLGTAGSRER